MIKVNKRAVIGAFTVFLMSIVISACTNTENTLSNAETQVTSTDASATPKTQDAAPDHMSMEEETVSETEVQNGALVPDALVYTIHKAELFSDYTQAGISKDEMNPFVESFLLDEQGDIKSSVKFIVVEMTIENRRAELDRNITSFSLLCADSDKDTLDETAEINFFELPFPSYFSNPSGKKVEEDWKGYYAYRLPVGQSKTLKVGWYVDLDQYDTSKLYLAFNRYLDEYKKYVKLIF